MQQATGSRLQAARSSRIRQAEAAGSMGRKHAAGSTQYVVGNRQHSARSMQQAACSRQQVAGCWQHAAVIMQQTAHSTYCNTQHVVRSRLQIAGSRK